MDRVLFVIGNTGKQLMHAQAVNSHNLANANTTKEADGTTSRRQPALFEQVLELCENGNEEIAYDMLWSGKAYSEDEAQAAQAAKENYAA